MHGSQLGRVRLDDYIQIETNVLILGPNSSQNPSQMEYVAKSVWTLATGATSAKASVHTCIEHQGRSN